MRALIFAAFAGLSLLSTPAQAQETASPAAQSAPSQAALTAAHSMLNTMLVDSDAFHIALTNAFGQQMPALRSTIQSSENYRRLSGSQQQAVLAVFDSMPQMAEEEINNALPSVLDAAANDLIAGFSEQELIDIAAFMSRPDVKPAITRTILAGVNQSTGGGTPALTFSAEEQAALEEFAATPSGRAFNERSQRVLDAVGKTIESGFVAVGPRLQRRVATAACEAMGNRCPPALRDAAQNRT